MNRPIGEVIDRVAVLIPETYESVRADLKALRTTVAYTAPELIGDRWRRFALILQEGLPSPGPESPEWCKQISRIMRGTE